MVLPSCGITYYSKIAVHQVKILWRAEPIDKIINENKLNPEQINKLKLIQEVKAFGHNKLGLKRSDNYSEYSQLDEPYVSYVVNAAGKYSLDAYLWHYPIVGKLTYKGFPRKKDAVVEQNRLIQEGYDTHIRGVSAYSTLGWFDDPVLSSMMNYSEENLVELILHESVHVHLYIKSNADFNEQLANFFAKKATQLFYQQKGIDHSSKQSRIDHDQKLFAVFMEKQKSILEENYSQWGDIDEKKKQDKKIALFKKLVESYETKLRPRLKILSFDHIINKNLNNARISLYGTYSDNQEHFERLYSLLGNDPKKFLDYFSSWEKEKNPVERLKSINAENL